MLEWCIMALHTFYTSSEKTWAAMLGEITRAERSIFIEMYIMVDDARGAEFIRLLGEKARSGVLVKLVLDLFGSFSLSNDAVTALRASGVEVFFFSRWLHRLHRKILIVDERIVITGGVNIHYSAATWTDLALRIRERHAVRAALGVFAKTYYMSGGTDISMQRYLHGPVFNEAKNSFQQYSSLGKKKTLKRLYTEKLFGAKNSVVLVTPYFAPDRWLVAALDAAALRGVTVDILIPETGDSWFMDRVNHFYILKMVKTNVRFFLFSKMNHAKVLVVDEKEALVGSQNLDSLSFNLNVESGLLVRDQKMVGDIARIVESWKEESVVFPKGVYVRRWYDYILAPVIRLFQPFL